MNELNVIQMFWFFLLFRIASGVRNGAMYDNRNTGAKTQAWAVVAMLLFISALTVFVKAEKWGFLSDQAVFWLSFASVIAAMIAATTALQYRNPDAPAWARDLHLWTTLEQMAAWPMLLLGGWDGVVAALCVVYPAVLIQKAIINRYIEQEWDYNGTDDPTGKTFAIPSLGIKIPRTTQRTRLYLSVASVVALALYAALK